MEPPSKHSVTVLNDSGEILALESIPSAVRASLLRAEPSEVRVLFTSDERVRALNKQFRGIDEATDVLTFPDDSAASGDIAIAVPFASRQAAARGMPVEIELVYLAVHGSLHLLGMDDCTENERIGMVRRMNEVMAQLGLPVDENWSSLHEASGVA
jgi:probable rRNA maturation factor